METAARAYSTRNSQQLFLNIYSDLYLYALIRILNTFLDIYNKL